MNTRQLALLQEILSLCQSKAIPIWVRGGWAVDFALGQITREHEDIDLFAWAKDAERLTEAFEQPGFCSQKGPPPEVQRDFTRGEESIQVALVDLNSQREAIVAGEPAKGSVWPQGMLGSHRGHIGELVCPIVNPLVQIEIKEQTPVWRPDLPRCEKHTSDIARLRDRFTETAQEAPCLETGEEWASLMRGLGRGVNHVFVHLIFSYWQVVEHMIEYYRENGYYSEDKTAYNIRTVCRIACYANCLSGFLELCESVRFYTWQHEQCGAAAKGDV